MKLLEPDSIVRSTCPYCGVGCQMDLHILTGNNVIRISQNLGTLSSGCRLDPEGLANAVGPAACNRPHLV